MLDFLCENPLEERCWSNAQNYELNVKNMKQIYDFLSICCMIGVQGTILIGTDQ